MPRFVLESIPGLECVEMERNGEHALCCGGGGGNFFTDLLGSGERSPSRIRIREAHDTGAAAVMVACPNCHNLLEDAAKTEGLSENMAVYDIAELFMRSAFPED
jgi:Fe-S oxidoreductase